VLLRAGGALLRIAGLEPLAVAGSVLLAVAGAIYGAATVRTLAFTVVDPAPPASPIVGTAVGGVAARRLAAPSSVASRRAVGRPAAGPGRAPQSHARDRERDGTPEADAGGEQGGEGEVGPVDGRGPAAGSGRDRHLALHPARQAHEGGGGHGQPRKLRTGMPKYAPSWRQIQNYIGIAGCARGVRPKIPGSINFPW
jgi:hypothetical protein